MKKNRSILLPHRLMLVMLLALYAPWAMAQNVTVKGKVISLENNSALPGVNVTVKGSTTGTITDASGAYSISAPADGTLVFSFIGFTSEEAPINNRSTIDINLAPDIKALSEVVVVAYGEKSQKLLTESIGSVKAQEIQRLPVASPDAAIQGRVSGVQITSVNGTPGSPVAVRIRGVGTVGNTQPLYVIDGVPLGQPEGGTTNPLASINPADIDNISVLKDASAAALYGVRAANGVVLITTKRGKTGKPRVSLDVYKGIQNFPANRLPEWNNTEQFIGLVEDMYRNSNQQNNLQPGDKDYLTLNPSLAPDSVLRNINTDWQRAAIRKNAPISNYNLNIGGGTEAATYNVSLGYFNQAATIPRWDLTRYNFRINSDYKIGKRFRIGQNLSVAYQQTHRGNNGGGQGYLYATAANMPPFFQIYEDPNNPITGNRYGYNGNYLPNGSGVAGITVGNPLALNAIYDTYDHNVRLLGGLFGELEIIDGLTFRSAASIDFNIDRNRAWNPDYTLQEAGLARVSEGGDSRSEGYTQVFTNTLTYNKTIGNHTFNALAGIEYQKIRSTNLYYNSSNYLSNSPDYYVVVGNGQGPDAGFNNAGGGANNMAYVGYLGRLSYDYKQKYLLTASFRRDGTANFAPELRYGNFPAVSAAWRISEEPFFGNVSFISDFKLRGSWGQMGNSTNSGNFPFISGVTTNPNYGLGRPNRSVQVAAPLPGVLPNPAVTWETVETSDFGIDVSFFNNKLNLLATYYFRNTKDFLFPLPVPRTAGYANQSAGTPATTPPNIYVNLGRVTNQGVELELNYQTNVTKDLSVTISSNLTTVKNRLAELYPNIQEYSSGDYRTAVGYPIGYMYGYKMLGIYQNQGEADAALPDNQSSKRPQAGDIIFEDNNSPASADQLKQGIQYSGIPNDTITAADRTYLGKTIPDFFYGITLGAQFKGFDLSALFAGVSGVQLYNEFRRNNEGMSGYGRNMLATTQNRWTGEGSSTTMPRAVAGDPYGNNRFSSRWIEDAGFFRLRNLQVGYTIPKTLLEKTKVFSNVRVYVAGSNLFVITKYTGIDPEVQTPGSEARQTGAGTDVGNVPQPRTFQGGIQVQF